MGVGVAVAAGFVGAVITVALFYALPIQVSTWFERFAAYRDAALALLDDED